jgi:hypothetical protein
LRLPAQDQPDHQTDERKTRHRNDMDGIDMIYAAGDARQQQRGHPAPASNKCIKTGIETPGIPHF